MKLRLEVGKRYRIVFTEIPGVLNVGHKPQFVEIIGEESSRYRIK